MHRYVYTEALTIITVAILIPQSLLRRCTHFSADGACSVFQHFVAHASLLALAAEGGYPSVLLLFLSLAILPWQMLRAEY